MKTIDLVATEPAASMGVDGCACADGCACDVNQPAIADPQARQWAWWLTAATIGWNSLEAVIAIVGGILAGSIALVGFGLDSVVEVASAIVIVWRLSQRSADHVAQERAERRAVRLIALSFFGIAAYVTVDAVSALLGLRDEPQRSPLGLAITALSLVMMPALAWAKRRVAARLNSVALKPMRQRRNCVLTCPRLSYSGSPPTPSWAGGGWIRSLGWWSPHWQAAKAARHGRVVSCATADPVWAAVIRDASDSAAAPPAMGKGLTRHETNFDKF
jgi:hypothetical protein